MVFRSMVPTMLLIFVNWSRQWKRWVLTKTKGRKCFRLFLEFYIWEMSCLLRARTMKPQLESMNVSFEKYLLNKVVFKIKFCWVAHKIQKLARKESSCKYLDSLFVVLILLSWNKIWSTSWLPNLTHFGSRTT